MKFSRKSVVFICLTAIICTCSAFKEDDDDESQEKPSLFFPLLHQNKPRTFNIFSKPPEPENSKYSGTIVSHLGNILHGGSFGFEIRPFAPIHGFLEHAKKFIPGGHGTVGRPHHEKPPSFEPPKKGDWEDEKDEWEMKDPVKPELEKPEPEKPEQVGPHWEDIGEGPEDDDGTDIIQPRVRPRSRPKRFIESKIYHVPLLYRSNGRPYQVRIKSRNNLDTERFSKEI